MSEVQEATFLAWLAVALIIWVDWRAGDGVGALIFSGFGALGMLPWMFRDPATSWRGWLALAVLAGFGLCRIAIERRMFHVKHARLIIPLKGKNQSSCRGGSSALATHGMPRQKPPINSAPTKADQNAGPSAG